MIEFFILDPERIKSFMWLFSSWFRKKTLDNSIHLNMMIILCILKTSSLMWGTTHDNQPVTPYSFLICFYLLFHKCDTTKTNIVWICSTIIWYLLFFITFVIQLVLYIGWWQYVWEEFLITNTRDCFLNALLGNSRIVIHFFHSCTINISQAKNSKTRKNNLDNYIAPFPWLIVINIPNCLVKFVIGRNNDELCRRCSGLDNFTHPQVSVHPHEIYIHSSLISTK